MCVLEGLDTPCLSKLGSTYMSFWRECTDTCNYTSSRHYRDDEVLDIVCEPTAEDIVRAMRLKYLRRLLASDQRLLVRLICLCGVQPGTWLHAIVSDLCWLKDTLADKLSSLPNPVDDLHPWLSLCQSSAWKCLIQRALDSAPRKKRVISPTQTVIDTSFACDACSRSFTSYPALCGHRYRVHAYKNPLRSYMPTATCLSCLKMFGNRTRLLCHLMSRSPRCATDLVARFSPLPSDVVDILDSKDVLHKCCKVNPCRQLYGPLQAHASVQALRPLSVADIC